MSTYTQFSRLIYDVKRILNSIKLIAAKSMVDKNSLYNVSFDEPFSANRLKSYLRDIFPELSGEFSMVQLIGGQSIVRKLMKLGKSPPENFTLHLQCLDWQLFLRVNIRDQCKGMRVHLILMNSA